MCVCVCVCCVRVRVCACACVCVCVHGKEVEGVINIIKFFCTYITLRQRRSDMHARITTGSVHHNG